MEKWLPRAKEEQRFTMQDKSVSDTVNLLWTGGWDSTFRLLQLLCDTGARVQPIYLVDENRASTRREIETMRSIRSEVRCRMPESSGQLLPTDYGSFGAIKIKPFHSEQWKALKEKVRVGYQYPNFASYAEERDLDRIELCIGQHVGEGSSLSSLIDPFLEIQETPAGPVPALSEEANGPEAMLARFTFPLINRTKLGMKEESERRNWMPIMQKAWSCFNPVLGFPCGECHPCKTARKKGMGYRIGGIGPILNSIRKLVVQTRIQLGRWRKNNGQHELTQF